MKKVIAAFLLILGVFEMFLPFLAAVQRYSFDPKFVRVFNFANATEEQRQLYRQFKIAMGSSWSPVFYCGMATIILGLLLLWADGKKTRGV